MSSIVLELQADCLNAKARLPVLLRKALVIATKLKVPEFGSWIQNELSGYYGKQDVPAYRSIVTDVQAQDQWGRWAPIAFTESKFKDLICRTPLLDSIAELEALIDRASREEGSRLQIPFSPEQIQTLRQFLKWNVAGHYTPTRFARLEDVRGVLDTVKTELLSWCLKLEQDGILGTGMSFSKEEQKKAAAIHHTTNFNIGAMTQSQIQHGNESSSATLNIGLLDVKKLNRLSEIVEENETGLGKELKQQLDPQLMALRLEISAATPDQTRIQSAVHTIKSTLENAAGNIVAAGLLYEIGKLFS